MKNNKKQKNNMLRSLIFLGIIIILTIILLLLFPEKQGAVAKVSMEFLVEMIKILPAVMVLMGFFTVWVPREMVVIYLGKASGIRGILLSILLGALPTGPLYVAFPLASGLIKKGAGIGNIVIFLSAWACIKIPQEMVELQFLGFPFMAARLILTIVLVIFMGLLIERIVD